MSSTVPNVTVSFEESECITTGGSKITTHRAYVDRTWVAVHRLPRATVKQSNPTPGIVWHRVVEVSLPVGTRIERIVESSKREPSPDVGSVLFGRSRGLVRQRHVASLIVDIDGRLGTRATRR